MSTTNGSAAKYNILERTKRTGIATTIDESKINPELLKQLEEDSSDDEDFIPDISSSMNEDENDHDDDDGSSDSSDDSSESENENEDKMNSDERSTSEIRGENDDSRLNGHNEDTVTSISKSSTTKRKSTSRKSTGSVVKKGSKAKKKAKSKIQLKYKEIDEEALKILKSFKNVPKVSPTNQQRQTPSDAKKRKSGTVEKEDRSMIRPSGVNTGPYVQRVKQKLMHDSSQLSEYYMCVVKQSETASESNTSVAGGNLVETSGRYKSVVPRERSFPIERKDEPWICCFCSNKANFMDGIGELYGPYRVSDDLEADIVFDATKDNEEPFREIWFHEGCASWSPSIFVKDYRIYGLAAALRSSIDTKCMSCKVKGANVTCRVPKCNRAYHYPCSIRNGCTFDLDTFTSLCSVHSQ